MLTIRVSEIELFNQYTQEISYIPAQELRLEHSLISLAAWESAHKKPFIDSKHGLTVGEFRDYIRCMTINKGVDQRVYDYLGEDVIQRVLNYIDDPMTAATFKNEKETHSREFVTAETIYYAMIAHNIPQEYQKWHLNRLMALIKTCNVKSQPEKKMTPKEAAAYHREVNARNRALLKTKG